MTPHTPMLNRLKSVASTLKREVDVYRVVLKDSRTPRPAKLLLGLAIGYLFLPFDLISDFIPVVGQLDDVIIVPAMVILALKMIPRDVVEDCRERAKST